MKATRVLAEDHKVIERGLGLLEQVVGAMDDGEIPARDYLDQLVRFFKDFVDEYHHAQEEQIFFPLLESHGFPRHREPADGMLREHERCRVLFGEMVDQVSKLTKEDGAAAAFTALARQYLTVLREHMFKEDNLFYQYADEVLNADERSSITRAFLDKEEVILGHGGRGIYSDLIGDLERQLFGVKLTVAGR